MTFSKGLVKENNWKLREIQDITGLAQKTLSNWHRGVTMPSRANFKMVLRVLAKRIDKVDKLEYTKTNLAIYESIRKSYDKTRGIGQ